MYRRIKAQIFVCLQHIELTVNRQGAVSRKVSRKQRILNPIQDTLKMINVERQDVFGLTQWSNIGL